MKKLSFTLIAAFVLFTACKNTAKKEAKENPAVKTENPAENAQASKTIHYDLHWTGFKTPDKVAVPGTFTKIDLSNLNKDGKSIEQRLDKARFSIDPGSVDSGNEDRDKKIAQGFFGMMAGKGITGSFGAFKDGKVPVSITMNAVTKQIPFTYHKQGDTSVLTGQIDIIKDFAAGTALQHFAKLCEALHQGKTWPEAQIRVRFYE